MRKRWGMITTPFRNFASSVLSKRSGAMLFRQSLQASPAMFPTLTGRKLAPRSCRKGLRSTQNTKKSRTIDRGRSM